MNYLEALLGIKADRFFSEYYHQKHLYTPSHQGVDFDGILTLEDIDQRLASVELKAGEVSFANKRSDVDPELYFQLKGEKDWRLNQLNIERLLGQVRTGNNSNTQPVRTVYSEIRRLLFPSRA